MSTREGTGNDLAGKISDRPVILAVDDEPPVLSAIERDLRRRYGAEYRILRAASGASALETVRQLRHRGDAVALLMTDQRMPGVSGTDFLLEAIRLYPEARKILLTAYADTDAAIASINRIGLDHYLMKPWDPPDLHLYPVLDELLEDWSAEARFPYQGIRVAGTLWSARSHEVKDFFARNQVPYHWVDVETDPEAKELLASAGIAQPRLPLVFFPDGSLEMDPSSRALADRLGLQTRARLPFYDLVIVGAGPAGLAAAVYGASEGLRTVLLEKEGPGGQAGTSSRIENYLGFPNGLSGADLARRAAAQARRLGAEILTTQLVQRVRNEDPYRYVLLEDGSELSCRALLIATGLSVSELDVPGARELAGAGLYYGAATTEALHYRERNVVVVGGGNSAGQGALFFSRYASRVTLLVRAESLASGMSRYLIDQIEATENCDVHCGVQVTEVAGRERLEAVTIREAASGRVRTLPAAAMFVFIGARAHTAWIGDVVERDPAGFILTGPDLRRENRPPRAWPLSRDPFLLETSVPGIFAAGDARHGSTKRVASAVGEGAVAVSLVHEYLKSV